MIGNERQRPAPWPGFRSGFRVLAFFVALDLLFVFMLPAEARELRAGSLIVIGLLGTWRWAWNTVHIVRSFIFSHIAFPRRRALAEAIPEERRYPDRIYILIPTYREQPWISRRVLTAIVREAGTVPCPITVIVSSGSEAEEAVFLRALRDHPDRDRLDIMLMRQRHGKRTALGHALRSISRRQGEETSLAIFMDGDTVLGPDVLRKCLPLFALSPRIGAVTTDEISLVEGARWYRNWYALRFAQRHRLMKSLSLSRRVLTLTGRFSIVRTEIATSEEFLAYLEDDALDHWLYGRFKFLTGDDKSTWFCLLRQGWEMHYVPDAIVYSMESSGDEPFKTAIAKMHRWFGNMLRNNGRAIALGPRRMGLFTWWCLVDQRISIWTALAGPVGAILMSLYFSPWFVCLYLFVAVLVRLAYLMVLSLEGLRLSVLHLPQLFFTQWVGALVKIHVQFRLNRQSWGADRGGSQNHLPGNAPAWMRRWVPVYQTVTSVAVFVGLVAILVGVLRVPSWPPFALASEAAAAPIVLKSTGGTGTSLDARRFGLDARDDEPDSDALDRALAALPPSGRGEIELPAGRIVLDRPLIVERDHTWITGAGSASTRLVARFDTGVGEAAVLVRGAGRTHRDRAKTLRTSLPAGRCLAGLAEAETFVAPDEVLWLGAPNEEPFLDDLGSRRWRRPFPWLRQTLVDVRALASNHALLRRPLSLSLPRGARAERVELREDVHLLDFALDLEVPGARFADTAGRYENLHPEYAVDGVAFHWVRDSSAERLRIERSGRHPLNLDQALRIALRDLEIDGAWNKGPGGMGYVRFARTYQSSLERSRVRGVRHVAFQWSAAGNRILNSRIEVDVNFHGGFSRDNEVVASVLAPPAGHPWPAIVRTPGDARWAPPDGPGNRATAAPSPAARCSAARST